MVTKKPKKTGRAQRPAHRPSAKHAPARRPAPAPKKARPPAPKTPSKIPAAPSPAPPEPTFPPRNVEERRHVLSLAFVRDGDDFLARIETNSDQIIELKNRSLDQLLTLVASELEDLLE
ncbi:MAG: hypothetical protein L3K14_08495 [Thermoplasmata archaeon]|nr:hypothetical protein [Thermoplasmata archaeon]